MYNLEGTQSIAHVTRSTSFESRYTLGPHDQRRERTHVAKGNVTNSEVPESPHKIPYHKWSIIVGHQSVSH